MEKSLAGFKSELAKMRTGRASLAILDNIRVEYFGQMMPLNQVATLGVPEPRLITIAPWDKSVIPAIEKAIDKANIGVSPVNDSGIVKLPIPSLTEERRKEIVKLSKGHGEECRVAVRHARKGAMDVLKKQEKTIPEDESKKLAAKIQELTDQYITQVDSALSKKEEEIMKV